VSIFKLKNFKDNTMIGVIRKYKDEEALAIHRKTDYFKAIGTRERLMFKYGFGKGGRVEPFS